MLLLLAFLQSHMVDLLLVLLLLAVQSSVTACTLVGQEGGWALLLDSSWHC
jgi:hypothetical protein